MIRIVHLILAAGTIATFLCCGVVYAESQSFGVADMQAVANTEGAQGAYLDFGELPGILGHRILYAKLYVSVAWDSCSGQDPEIDVHVASSQWNRSQVEQLSSWDSTSASIVKNLVFTANAEQTSEGVTEILVNEAVQAWADGKLTKHGLLVVRRGTDCDLNVLDESQSPDGYAIRLVIESIPNDY